MRDRYRTPKLPSPTPPAPWDAWDVDPTPTTSHPRVKRQPWTGPQEGDTEPGTGDVLRQPVPGSRWPYGPPETHQGVCLLHHGGRWCDCEASAADSPEWGHR